jgi:hypothetical protein
VLKFHLYFLFVQYICYVYYFYRFSQPKQNQGKHSHKCMQMKCLFSSYFNQMLSEELSKNPKYKKSPKICPARVKLFLVDNWWMDTHNKPKSHFYNCASKPKKHGTWNSQEAAQTKSHDPQLPWYNSIKIIIMVIKAFKCTKLKSFKTHK